MLEILYNLCNTDHTNSKKGVRYEMERKHYTEEEDKIIFDNYYDPEKRKKLPEMLNRTSGGISFHFYKNVLPKKGLSPKEYYELKNAEHNIEDNSETVEEEQIDIQKKTMDDNLLDVLHQIPEKHNELDRKVKEIEDRFSAMENSVDFYLKQFVSGVTGIAEMMNGREAALSEYERLKAENEQLENKVKELQDELDAQAAEFRRIYDELDFWLGRFMKLSSVDKIASLADFLPKLKLSIDKYGNLVKVQSIS